MAKDKNKCEKYELAITDYILGEEMDITREELLNHLATCDNCQKDLTNWRETYAAMRNKAYMEKPETKKKYQEMLERIKSSSCEKVPGKDVNINTKIGAPAGVIWRYLATNGWINVDELPKKTNLNKEIVHEAIGWLGKEGKILMTEEKQTTYVCLADHERKNAQMQE